MTWAAKRRWQYLGGFFGFIFIILFIFLYPIIFKKPTCTDGKQNGIETGVDCGGACSLMCKENISEPLVEWSRSFHVVGNTYNMVAFVKNQNKSSGVEKANYEFRLYDENNRLLGRRQGTTYIPPNKDFAIFESRFDAGESKIKSTTFEFIDTLVWVKKDPIINTLPISVDNITMGEDKKSPSVSAVVKNESIYDVPSFESIVILYDEQGNAINASKTSKNELRSGDSMPLFFTWPEALLEEPVIKNVLIQINPWIFTF